MTFLEWCGRYSRRHPRFDEEIWQFCLAWAYERSKPRRAPRDFWSVRDWLNSTGRAEMLPAAKRAWEEWSGQPLPDYQTRGAG